MNNNAFAATPSLIPRNWIVQPERLQLTTAIFERVRTIIGHQLNVSPDKVTRGAKLRGEVLKADSLDLVNLIMAFAVEFGVEMRDDEVQKIVTVEDVITYLQAVGA